MSVILAIGVFVLLSITGCCSEWHVTEYGTEGQPWFGPEEQAEGEHKHRRCCISFENKYIWHGPGRTFVDAEETVRDCKHYLAFRGFWKDPEYVRNAGPDHMAGRSPQTVKTARILSIPVGVRAPISVVAYEETRVIVCLKPTVVLAIPEPAYVWSTSEVVQYPAGGRTPTEPFIVLPGGFDFGIRLPHHEDVSWFSPDLRVGPERPRRVSEDEMRISVPWGELILLREEDDWVVHRQRSALR
jgi:hypothetical protein